MKITEIALTKNKWHFINSSGDKSDLAPELINVVQHAYAATDKGSFVNTVSDVMPSDWYAIDWDPETDVDAAIFARKQRSGETWTGSKIQGIGHDGQKKSKQLMLAKLEELLTKSGIWIEASGPLQKVLLRNGVQPVTDVNVLNKLFGKVKMVDQNTYKRKLDNGTVIVQTVFGKPTV